MVLRSTPLLKLPFMCVCVSAGMGNNDVWDIIWGYSQRTIYEVGVATRARWLSVQCRAML